MRHRSERGAIIIQVAVCLLGLTAFSALVIDYGILWSARSQAQNAADAGALAGTIARAFDDTARPPATSKVRESIIAAVQANPIWGEATPDDAAIEIGYEDDDCPTPHAGKCVRVTVHRDGTGTSKTIPTWFASLVGVDDQHIVATATGHVGVGNTTTCMKPWLIPDRWLDSSPTTPDEYDPSDGDVYTFPGWKTSDIGGNIVLQPGNTDPALKQEPVDFYRIHTGDVNMPFDDTEYLNAIEGCTFKAKVGDTLYVEPDDSTKLSTTATGVDYLASQDSSAWHPGSNSPRVVFLGVYDTSTFDSLKTPKGTAPFGVVLTNIVALYIIGIDAGGGINGFIASKAGGFIENGATPIPDDASFLPVIRLVR